MRLAPFVLVLLLLPLIVRTPTVAGATADFTLTAFYTYSTGAPSNVVIVTGQNGFIGTVTLGLSTPAGFTASLTPSTATLDQTTTSVNLSLVANGNPIGDYVVNVTGTSGSLSHILQIKYNIVSQTSPNIIVDSSSGLTGGWDILRGSSSGSTIVVSSTNGFAGKVSLQATSFPSGLLTSFDTSTVTVQPTKSGVTNMGLSAPGSIPVGIYTLVLTGTSGTITQVVYLDVIVTYGIGLSANPRLLTIAQGGSASSTITLSSLGGWTGTTGLSATCSPGITCSLNPSNLQIQTPTSTVQSNLMISSASTMLPGSYTVDVSETGPVPSPSFLQGAQLTVVVTGPDFTVSVFPNALTFSPGQTGSLQTTVTLASVDGFSGYLNTTVSVSPSVGPPLPDPPSANPTSINLTQVNLSGPQSLTITISVDAMVLVGPYIVQITAVTKLSGGLLSHSAYLTATVGPDFSISAPSSDLIIHQGTLATSTIAFTSLNGFAGGIMLLLEPFSALPPDPRNYFFPTYPILSPGGTNSTVLVVMADQFTGLGTFKAWVDASTSVQVGFGWASHAFPMTITIEGPVTGRDFTLSAQPSHSYVSIGSTTTITLSLTSINGFSGSSILQVESYGLLGSLSPSTVYMSSANSGSSTLTITAPMPYQIDGYPLWYPFSGNRSLLVIASTWMGLSHGIWINVTEAPVSVVPNPTQLDIPTGSSTTSQIVVSSLSVFNLTVAMSAVVSPSGLTTSLSNSLINFSSSIAPVSLALTINVPSTAAQGDYIVLVTATSMSHQWFCQCGYYNITYTTPIDVRAVAPSTPPSGPGTNPSPKPNGSTAGIFGLPPTEFYGIITAAAAATALVISAGYLRFRRHKIVT